jgi:hypothetical protein
VKREAKRKLCWDTVEPGLVLSVEPTGHKSFKLIYTLNGRARWYTIGNANKVGLKDARSIVRRKMGLVADNVDVQAERQIARQPEFHSPRPALRPDPNLQMRLPYPCRRDRGARD